MMLGQLAVPVNDRDHTVGQPDAPVTLVEYGDFECPHCGAAHPIIQMAQRYLGEQLCFVYRHFPLSEIHPHAERAAEASEAAGAQGKFWAMHDMLFEHQNALEDEDLLRYAQALRLDVRRVAIELGQGVHAKRVHDDFRGGVRSGVNGTPTFFLNGVRYDGPWNDPVTFIAVLSQVAADERGATVGIDR